MASSRAFMYRGSLQPGWESYVRPVGTTQGAGSVTAVSTYIMWLMAAIPIAAACQYKKTPPKIGFCHTSQKIASPVPTS